MTTKKYNAEIEREAEYYFYRHYDDESEDLMRGIMDDFSKGIHSELNNRIIEIEKREFAVAILKGIFEDGLGKIDDSGSKDDLIDDYIIYVTQLNNEINQLKNEQ